jgi:hypothetical protein
LLALWSKYVAQESFYHKKLALIQKSPNLLTDYEPVEIIDEL